MYKWAIQKTRVAKELEGVQADERAPYQKINKRASERASRRDNMKVKKLIEILKQAPQNIDVNIFDYSTEYLLSIDDIWIPKKEDMEDNPEVQITINKQASEQKG